MSPRSEDDHDDACERREDSVEDCEVRDADEEHTFCHSSTLAKPQTAQSSRLTTDGLAARGARLHLFAQEDTTSPRTGTAGGANYLAVDGGCGVTQRRLSDVSSSIPGSSAHNKR